MAEEESKKENTDEQKKEDMKFPEFVELEEEKIEGMSHEEKLRLIEKEAQTLYDFCLQKGLSKKDMSWCLKPLFGSPPEYVKKVVQDNSKFCLTLAFIFGLVAVCVGWTPVYDRICVHGKLALLKVLPYWDWTYLYNEECLINNPYIAPLPNITKEECAVCFEIQKSGLETLVNATEDVVTNDFLLADFPAVIEDGIKGWPKPKITIPMLSKLYSKHPDLDTVGDCRFNSSIENLFNVYDLFSLDQKEGLPDKYFASWENCDLKAAKHFRLFYRRPYFLPAMAEAAKTNSFLIAKGKFEDPVVFETDDQASGIWITVIKGEAWVDLVPIDGCSKFKGCKYVSTKITAGQAVLLPTRLWSLDILPNSKGETIVLGSTAQWDEMESGAPMSEEEMKQQYPDMQEGDMYQEEPPRNSKYGAPRSDRPPRGVPEDYGDDQYPEEEAYPKSKKLSKKASKQAPQDDEGDDGYPEDEMEPEEGMQDRAPSNKKYGRNNPPRDEPSDEDLGDGYPEDEIEPEEGMRDQAPSKKKTGKNTPSKDAPLDEELDDKPEDQAEGEDPSSQELPSSGKESQSEKSK